MSGRLAALALALACAAGCVVVREQPARRGGGAPPPSTAAARQATARLIDEIGARVVRRGGWPAHLPRSRDFPELPLAQLAPVEDRGAYGLDTVALRNVVERQLRDAFLVRFDEDERGVPPSLREEGAGGPRPRGTSLRIEGWAAEDGRFYLQVRDVSQDRVLAQAHSD